MVVSKQYLLTLIQDTRKLLKAERENKLIKTCKKKLNDANNR